MELEKAIKMLRKTVKHTGTIDQKHIDLTLVPITERPIYEKALQVSTLAIQQGKISRDEFLYRVHINDSV